MKLRAQVSRTVRACDHSGFEWLLSVLDHGDHRSGRNVCDFAGDG
jgi:hypothetical protein